MSENLTPREAVAYLSAKGIRKSESSLAVARFRGYPAGPRFLKVGTAQSGRVYYPQDELDAWIKAHGSKAAEITLCESTADVQRSGGSHEQD